MLGVNGAVRGGGYEGDGCAGTIAAGAVFCSIDRLDQLYRINRFDRCYALVRIREAGNSSSMATKVRSNVRRFASNLRQENLMSVDVKYRTSAIATGGRDG